MLDTIGRITVFTGTCSRLAIAGEPDVDSVPYTVVNSGQTFPLTTQYPFAFSIEGPSSFLQIARTAIEWLAYGPSKAKLAFSPFPYPAVHRRRFPYAYASFRSRRISSPITAVQDRTDL